MPQTPRHVLRQRILAILASVDTGRMARADLLAQLKADFTGRWTPEDLKINQQQGAQEKWRINASFARKDMVDDGELVNDDAGYWTLTQVGWSIANGNEQQLDLLLTQYIWDISPGEILSRQERMDRFGGGKQGGIEGSLKTPNVFVYSDPEKGGLFGYDYDGWDTTGEVFLYTGEGQQGDQRLRLGNRVLLDHVKDERSVRLFVADGYRPGTVEKIQRYLGEFEVDASLPFYRAEAPDTTGEQRSVIVFRLRPRGEVLRRDADRSPTLESGKQPVATIEPIESTSPEAIAAAVPTEAVNSEDFKKSGVLDGVAVRREAQLVGRFQKFLEAAGHSLGRYRLRPPGELRDLYTDIFDYTGNCLYEAKATSTRDAVRMALGQLLDYSRYVPNSPSLAVLLPSEPSTDMQALLRSHGIHCVFETTNGVFIGVER